MKLTFTDLQLEELAEVADAPVGPKDKAGPLLAKQQGERGDQHTDGLALAVGQLPRHLQGFVFYFLNQEVFGGEEEERARGEGTGVDGRWGG